MLDRTEPFVTALTQSIQDVIGLLPEMIGTVALLVAGWLLARLARALTVRFAGGINRAASALGLGQLSTASGISPSTARIIGGIVFWLVILFFIAAAASLLGLTMFAGWLDRLVAYLPNILSGLLIIFAGAVVANLAHDAAAAATSRLPATQRAVVARAVQVLTLTVLIIVGVAQIGIDITVVITVLSISLAAILGGLSLAFALGARTYVANLIGAHHMGRDYRVGERIRIGDTEGHILEISTTTIVLETAAGRMSVPARLFSEESVLLMPEGTQHG